VRLVVSLAFPFLAYASSTLLYQDTCPFPQDTFVAKYRARWSSCFGSSPVGFLAHKQLAWDGLGVLADRNIMESLLTNQR